MINRMIGFIHTVLDLSEGSKNFKQTRITNKTRLAACINMKTVLHFKKTLFEANLILLRLTRVRVNKGTCRIPETRNVVIKTQTALSSESVVAIETQYEPQVMF